VYEQRSERELERLRREELLVLQEELARSAVHSDIDGCSTGSGLIHRELSLRRPHASARSKFNQVIIQLLDLARQCPEHAGEHEGLMALTSQLGGPAWDVLDD
jgi:hypothetical protein